MMLRNLLLFFSLLTTASTQAQPVLQRSAFLGVSPVSAATGDPVEIATIHAGGTGSAIGLEVGDRLKQLNGKPIKDFPQLIAALSNTLEGESLTVTIDRGSKEILLKGIAQSRTKEQGSGYKTHYGEFQWQDNHVRTITYRPDSPRADKAAVMFIQGYTCDSIDYGMFPNITITQLLATYAQAGFSVFKMEKPGVGDSQGELTCSDYDFDTENAAFIAGLQHFKTTERISADNLFVFGHSLGVLHAGIIAEQGLAKGVIGYGGVLKSWYTYLQDIYTEQSVRYFGVDKTQAASNLSRVKPFLNQWLNTNKNWEQMSSDSTVKKALQSDLLPVSGEQVFSRHYRFFRSLNQHDFTALWANSQAHALMMHGTYDIQAIDGSWASDIAELVNNSDNGITAEAMFFERTEHSLMRYSSLAALRSAMSGGTHRAGTPGEAYNPEIAKSSLGWMQEILNKS